MPPRRPLSTAVVLASLVAPLLAAAALLAGEAPPKRAIDFKDLLQFRWIADPRIAPDGSRVAFVRVAVNADGTGYETSLWWAPSDGSTPPQALTRGPKDGQPRWSPDGRRLAFVRPGAGKEAKDAAPQIWILDTGGGEPWQLTDQARGAGSPAWSPDGSTLAFVSEATDDDVARQAKPDPQAAPPSDVTVVTRAVYRFNGAGTLDFSRPDHLWTIALPAPGAKPGTATRVTGGAYAEAAPVWTADGTALLFTSTHDLEPYFRTNQDEAWRVPATGGAMTKVASVAGNVGALSLSPDGKRAAFVGSPGEPVLSCTQQDLWVTTLDGAAPRNLTATLDAEVGEGISADQHPPRGGGNDDPLWTPDGKALLVKVGRQGRSNLERFDVATGAATPLTHGDQEVIAYTIARDGRIAATIANGTRFGELYVLAADGGAPRRIASVNEELLAGLDLSTPEEIWYPSFDGTRIQAWLVRPPHADPKARLPLILYVHGGPHSAYGWTFFHEFEALAAAGYAVLYPNPRGSTTYGNRFCNSIQYRYPGDDAKDLLAGVDFLVARGIADPARLGVTGGSGGGILTNWIVTQTDRFRGAVAQRSIADWSQFWYDADFWLAQPSWFRGAPFEARQKADFAARSPITFVDRVKTPLLLIEGDADLRTPPGAGGEQMFRALKYLHRPTAMVRFPGESHELSRSGQPWHRIERMRHIAAWFDKYVRGERVPGYEVGEEGQAAAGRRE